MKLIVVSGGFDPIHSGHIAYFKAAKDLGDKLIVALNSDEWLENKKGKYFMPFKERKIILESIYYVDEAISFEDDDLGSCINALEKVKRLYPDADIYFANGGDRTKKIYLKWMFQVLNSSLVLEGMTRRIHHPGF